MHKLQRLVLKIKVKLHRIVVKWTITKLYESFIASSSLADSTKLKRSDLLLGHFLYVHF
jgi:hypothetical protein